MSLLALAKQSLDSEVKFFVCEVTGGCFLHLSVETHGGLGW